MMPLIKNMLGQNQVKIQLSRKMIIGFFCSYLAIEKHGDSCRTKSLEETPQCEAKKNELQFFPTRGGSLAAKNALQFFVPCRKAQCFS